MRDKKDVQARIAELEQIYDARGGAVNPQNDKLLIERAALVWVLGGVNTIAPKKLW